MMPVRFAACVDPTPSPSHPLPPAAGCDQQQGHVALPPRPPVRGPPPRMPWPRHARGVVYHATETEGGEHVVRRHRGIDWADQHHDAVVIDERATRVGTLRVPHSAAGIQELTAFLLDIVRRGSTSARAGASTVSSPTGVDTPVPVSSIPVLVSSIPVL